MKCLIGIPAELGSDPANDPIPALPFSIERLKAAYYTQQPFVPDQLALVWRADLSRLMGDYIFKNAGREAFLERCQKLEAILNTPTLEPFLQAAVAEAKHQRYRWGDEADAKKTAWEWFWTLGYLGGKAANAALNSDWDKAKHHTITAAAMLANWHRHICGAEGRVNTFDRLFGTEVDEATTDAAGADFATRRIDRFNGEAV